jgi:hypothetical protein
VLQQGTWSVAELRKEMVARKLAHVDVERTMTLLAATGIAVPCAAPGRSTPMPPESKTGESKTGESKTGPRQIKIPLAVNRALVQRMVDQLAPGQVVSTLAGNAMGVDPIFAVILSLGGQPWNEKEELKERLVGEVKRRRIRFSKPAKEDKPLDDTARAAQFFDRFWTDEAPILHRLGVIEFSS